MGIVTFDPPLPNIGDPELTDANATPQLGADPAIKHAIELLQQEINGNLDDTNLVPGTAVPTYQTSLPATPTDGQEIYYGADPTNGVIWHLRYRAASASVYKWEFVGGASLSASVDTEEALAIPYSAVQDLATVGPSVTVPFAGDYELDYNAYATWGGGSNVVSIVPKIGAAAANPNHSALMPIDVGTGYITGCKKQLVTGVAASALIKLQYDSNSNLAASFGRRRLFVKPVRVG